MGSAHKKRQLSIIFLWKALPVISGTQFPQCNQRTCCLVILNVASGLLGLTLLDRLSLLSHSIFSCILYFSLILLLFTSPKLFFLFCGLFTAQFSHTLMAILFNLHGELHYHSYSLLESQS